MRDDMLSEVQIPTDVYDFELDKIQGFWVVTSWPGPDVVLRLRIRYWSREDLCDVICEARIGTCTEFEEIGRFEASLWELRCVRQSSPLDLHLPMPFGALPHNLRPVFASMGLRWAMCGDLLEFGGTDSPRYGDEPTSSHDCYELRSIITESGSG